MFVRNRRGREEREEKRRKTREGESEVGRRRHVISDKALFFVDLTLNGVVILGKDCEE